MNINCSCGIKGHLQKRGNSFRIQHYLGFNNGKRIYKYHKVSKTFLEQQLEVTSLPPKLVVVGSNPTPPATESRNKAESWFSNL